MASFTDYFGFLRLLQGDDFSLFGHQFSNGDRVKLDNILRRMSFHRHTGVAGVTATPPDAPTLEVDTTGGAIPASTRVFVKITKVDEWGFESAASPETFVDTPARVLDPAAPALTTFDTGGILLPGTYSYALTAYTDVNTRETRAVHRNYVTVRVGTTTNRVLIEFPSLPAGADGFNIYRRPPGGVRFDYLTSVAITGGLPLSFNDDGSIAEDCNRTTPIRNSTNGNNSVEVTYPGATPVLPDGVTWRIYRSYVTGAYDNSFLHHVVEETFEGSGIIATTYLDMGLGVGAGGPPTIGQQIDEPEPVELTDAAHVEGRLPMGAVSAFPWVEKVAMQGTVEATTGLFVIPIEFPQAMIQGCRAVLGPGFAPAAQELIVDVILHRFGATPFSVSIYTTEANRPFIPVGEQIGERTIPDIVELVEGDCLSVDVIQAGGGGTPTDENLVVSIYMHVYGWGLVSHIWDE